MTDPDLFYPCWDDLCFKYRNDSEIVKNTHFDHAMIGINVLKSPSYNTPLSVSFAKSYIQKCFHSVTSSMPCVSPKTSSDYFLSNLNYNKEEKTRQGEIKKKLADLKKRKQFKDYFDMIDLLLEEPFCIPDDDLPFFLKRYKKILIQTPDKNYWQHHKGGLKVVDVDDKCYALFSGGERFSSLMRVSFDHKSWDKESKVRDLKTRCVKEFKISDGPILQITTARVQDTVFGAVRQRKKTHLFNINNNCKLEQLSHLSTDDNLNYIIDVDPSPLIPGEFLYLTQNGRIELKKLATNTSKEINNDSQHEHNLPISVQFGQHPRCIIITSQSQVILLDLRSSSSRTLPLLTLPNVTLPDDDLFCAVAPFPGNDDLKIVTTSSSILLLDQRYPDVYLLKWSHLLQHPPEMTSINTLQNGDIITLSASISDQEVAMIHAEKNSPQVFTRCPTMLLSRPKDLLRLLPRGETHPIEPVLTAPLIGIGVLPTCTALQLTSSGHIYAQNIHLGVEDGSENDWRVGPGYQDPSDKSGTLEKWAEEVGEMCLSARRVRKLKKPKEKHSLDASGLREVLQRASKKRKMATLFDTAVKIPNVFETDNERYCGVKYGLWGVERESCRDEMSKKLMSVWTGSEELHPECTQ